VSAQADLAQRAALSLIAADAKLSRDIALDRRFEPVRPIAALALMPFLSAFVHDPARSIGWTDAAVGEPPHEVMLFASRMRVKLTEDKYRSSAEVIDKAEELSAVNSGWFLGGPPRPARSAEKIDLARSGLAVRAKRGRLHDGAEVREGQAANFAERQLREIHHPA
jgi:hypothetical protein